MPEKSTEDRTASTVPSQVSKATEAFMDLVDHFSYEQGPYPERELTNFTFWAGAGFSRAWDPKAALGGELFGFETRPLEKFVSISALSRLLGTDYLSEISYDQFRQIVYQLDMYERYPDVRPRYIDDQNIRFLRAVLGVAVIRRYQQKTNLNYIPPKSIKFPCSNPTPTQQDILGLFSYLLQRENGSERLTEGIRTHFVTTNYDFVIETILDAIFRAQDPDESLFLNIYRGFTPARVANLPNLSPVHQHDLVQHLLKINGGFEILRSREDYALDYSCRKPEDILARPPVLILPSREQNYGDPYFRTIFPKAVRLLRETTVLLLVGYSLPEDDALIRFILRQFAEAPEDGRDKHLFYIDPCGETKLEAITQVFPMIKDEAPKLHICKGGFDEFAAEFMPLAKLRMLPRRHCPSPSRRLPWVSSS